MLDGARLPTGWWEKALRQLLLAHELAQIFASIGSRGLGEGQYPRTTRAAGLGSCIRNGISVTAGIFPPATIERPMSTVTSLISPVIKLKLQAKITGYLGQHYS
jgi:hypothetical protein